MGKGVRRGGKGKKRRQKRRKREEKLDKIDTRKGRESQIPLRWGKTQKGLRRG